ncbi:MAG: serine hydrolase domain-containing protein [Solirubrobacterales bacterium]
MSRLGGHRRFLGSVAACLAVIVPAAGANAAAEPPVKTGKALRAALDEVIGAPEAPPGIAVLLHRKGEIQVLKRGVADVATGAKINRRQYMRIASVAKAFSGAVALALVSEGRLGLDDTIGQRLPGLLPLANDVTLREALQHTGGLPDYIFDPEFINDLVSDPGRYRSPTELVEFVADTPLTHTPGTRYEYSDTDNVVVGLMAEAATGMTYDQLLQQYVYGPAKLTGTSLPITVEMPEPYMHGYDVFADAPPFDTSELINPSGAWASGGIVSTMTDLDRFFRAYVGGDLFGRKARRAQNNFVIGSSQPPGPGRNRATLGLFRYASHCGTVYGHTGSFPGYRMLAASTANGKRSLVMVANSQIVAGFGSEEVSDLIRLTQEDAVCHLMR